MKTCPNCSTMMEEVDVSGLPEQPYDESKVPGVARVRFVCPGCHHLEEAYVRGRNLQNT
jgi:DNA-directed RNA polymerase subunit M/transcription elongation factor TFIIS